MKGDFSRNTFDPLKHFSRVLMQQGRVQLDADWNEQVAILLHYLQTLAKDLIGPYAGPAGDYWGFAIEQASDNTDFKIGPGRYYVEGILCENEKLIDNAKKEIPVTYFTQKDYPLDKTSDNDRLKTGTSLVYLDIWERLVTYLEDEDGNNPGIREVALGGPDTATRAKVVWQVKVTNEIIKETQPLPTDGKGWRDFVNDKWLQWLENWQPLNRGQLKAKGKEDLKNETDPCITSPESRYRGTENQLYRVEIHKSGKAGEATFKWSRENGSVVYPICKLTGNEVKLEHLGRDSRFGLKEGDWVEIVDDDYALQYPMQGQPRPLLQVESIDPVERIVTLHNPKAVPLPSYDEKSMKHPFLRRWDHQVSDDTGDAVRIQAEFNDSNAKWHTLEDGVQIQFVKTGENENAHYYRTGDYWLIPARTATGNVEWPQDGNGPIAQQPHGVEHHYAPLAIISVDGNGNIQSPTDLRHKIKLPIDPTP